MKTPQIAAMIARPFERAWIMLGLCLLVFYGPMFLSAGTAITGVDSDVIGHILYLLGDDRPGGRFFHYFDLAANARLWGNDVKFSPLHLLRIISMALGSHPQGWSVLIIGLHGALFLAVYHYSRAILRASTPAALIGAMVTFFSTSWYEFTAGVYGVAGTLPLIVSLCEYWLFLATARRRHLVRCVLANALQPYVIQSLTLIPAQACLLGGVLLMAAYRKGARRAAVLPLLLIVWPLSVLGWTPIVAPMIFAVGSGLTTREALQPMAWGLDFPRMTQALGFLCPVPQAVPVLFDKLGWSSVAFPPNGYLFSSFLFLPGLLALWRSGRRSLRMLMTGAVVYCLSFLAAELIMTPSALMTSLGFHRLFVLPTLAGFVVAAAMGVRMPQGPDTRAARLLHRFYWVVLGGALIGLIALAWVSEEWLAEIGSRFGLLGSGTVLPSLLLGSQVFCAGLALGLAGYLYLTAKRAWAPDVWRRSGLRSAALFVTIAAPVLGTGYGEMWYRRHASLDTMCSSPQEFRFIRERVPDYEYRVGFVLASEMLLAQGDWAGFWAAQRDERALYPLRQHDLRFREGLAFALPYLHFHAPVHNALRAAGNPFLQRWERPKARFLNRRNVIVRPEAELFEDYGVRYWLSNFDLHRAHPTQFVPVYEGKDATVYENPRAKPVAYWLEEPAVPLPLEHEPYGVRVALSRRRQGTFSVHLDLRSMGAWAIGPDGRRTPLTLEPSGLRWVMEVPPQSVAVVFTAREAGALTRLAAGAGLMFPLLVALTGFARPCGAGAGRRPADDQ